MTNYPFLYKHILFIKAVLGKRGLSGRGKKVKISLLQAVEAPRVARGRDSHIT
jgi:hypothetical protein